MIIYTDTPSYAAEIIGRDLEWQESAPRFGSAGLEALAERLFQNDPLYSAITEDSKTWQYLFLVKRAAVSQYDSVIDICQQNIELPHGLLCLADSGEKFHGLRGRPWTALPGNIHLTAHLKPNLKTTECGVGFTLISALAVIDAIDKIPGQKGRAMIKWVNDIFINDAKVAGFLTHTLSMEGIINDAVIGIGLNVETTPPIAVDPVIYKTISLGEIIPDSDICNQRIVFEYLIETLEENYGVLCSGGLPDLLTKYRDRSMIMGRKVEVIPDSPNNRNRETVQGKVVGIGQSLEVYLEGRDEPIRVGRMLRIT